MQGCRERRITVDQDSSVARRCAWAVYMRNGGSLAGSECGGGNLGLKLELRFRSGWAGQAQDGTGVQIAGVDATRLGMATAAAVGASAPGKLQAAAEIQGHMKTTARIEKNIPACFIFIIIPPIKSYKSVYNRCIQNSISLRRKIPGPSPARLAALPKVSDKRNKQGFAWCRQDLAA